MTTGRFAAIDKYLLGSALLLAIVFGGNSAPSYGIDQAIQLVMIVAAALVIWRNPGRLPDPRLLTLICAVVLAVSLQLVPLPSALIDPLQNIVQRVDPSLAPAPAFRPLSLGIGRTLEALGWVLACGLFTLAASMIDFRQAHELVPIFLIGVLFHLVAALLQYSAAGTGRAADGFLGYRVAAGLFANSNHFSALAFISIPPAFAYFYDRRRLSWFLAYLTVTLLILLAAGSRAGVLIGLAITLLSGLILFRRRVFGTLTLLSVAAIAGVFALGVWARIANEGLGSASRSTFAATTLRGLLDNLPFGIGYGGFVHAYPAYERAQDVFHTYVNHAHNDFLELVFEGGIPATLLIAAAVALLARRTVETLRWPLHFACALSLGFLLVHSAVDYPLRSLAISASFSLMTAILFHRGPADPGHTARPRGERRRRRSSRAGAAASAPSAGSTIADSNARSAATAPRRPARQSAMSHRS